MEGGVAGGSHAVALNVWILVRLRVRVTLNARNRIATCAWVCAWVYRGRRGGSRACARLEMQRASTHASTTHAPPTRASTTHAAAAHASVHAFIAHAFAVHAGARVSAAMGPHSLGMDAVAVGLTPIKQLPPLSP